MTLSTGASVREQPAVGEILSILIDAIGKQCREVLSRLAAVPERKARAR